MPATMTCFVMQGVGRVGLVEKPVPRAGPNDAVVRATAALVCTSDCHTVAGALGDRHGLTLGARGRRRYPRVGRGRGGERAV